MISTVFVVRFRRDPAAGPVLGARELGGAGEEVRPPQEELLRRRLREILRLPGTVHLRTERSKEGYWP